MERAYGTNHPEVAATLSDLARLYQAQERFKEAESLYERAVAIWEQAPEVDPEDLSAALKGLLSLYHSQQRYAATELLLIRGLALLEAHGGRDDPRIAAIIEKATRRFAEGERPPPAPASGAKGQEAYATETGKPLQSSQLERYRWQLRAFEETLGPDHPQVATLLNDVASLEAAAGNVKEAEASWRRALAIWQKDPELWVPQTARTLGNLGTLYLQQERAEEAVQVLEQARGMLLSLRGDRHKETWQVSLRLAKAYAALKRPREARDIYARVIRQMQGVLGKDHPEVLLVKEQYAALEEKGR